MVPLVFALQLLAAPPTLVERLNLGVTPSVESVRDSGGLRAREVVAGSTGAFIGHIESIALALLADKLFSGCDGDFCSVSPMVFVGFAAGELLLVPLMATAAAVAVEVEPAMGSWQASWLQATLGHVLGAALIVPAVFVNDATVAAVLIFAGLAVDCLLTGVGASRGLHVDTSENEVPPALIVPPPVEPSLQPPPSAGLRAPMLPLAFRF